jgi:hypothetical protein
MDIDSNPTSGRSPQQRRDVFISYSHEDKKWLDELNTMLQPLVRTGRITTWDDTKIRGGAKWRKEIDKALGSAKVAVLLVSPEFLASNFIAESELPPLLQAAEGGGLTILWIAVKPSLYDTTAIEEYQALNDPSKPLATIRKGERGKVLVDICKQIEQAVTAELISATSPTISSKPVDSPAHLAGSNSEVQSRPVRQHTENLIDFEDQRNLFKGMLAESSLKHLMFIQAPGGRGKTSLLRMLCFHCEQESIPCCSIDFSGQPYDNPHFTLALVMCDHLGITPTRLAGALQSLSTNRPQGKIDNPYVVSRILAGVSESHDGLRQRYMKERLKNAFLADLDQFALQKGRIIFLLDSIERLSAEEEEWLLENLLKPVATGKLQNVTVVTAGDRWPKINRWEWEQNTHLLDGLPTLKPEHIKIYAERVNIKITDAEATSYWKASGGGIPLYMAIVVYNLRTLSEVSK